VRCSDNEADAVRQSCCRCSASSLLDRLLVGIESRNLSLREIFGDSYADAARTAADVENASTLLQPGNYARHCLEPITRKSVFIWAAVDQVKCRDAVLAYVGEVYAAAFLERGGDLRRKAQKDGCEAKQSAHEVIGLV